MVRLRHAVALFGFALPIFAQFDGPAVLSRGQTPAAMQSPQIDLRPFVAISGVYDTGLTGVMLTDQGQLANTAAAGVELTGGISGVHSWKNTQVGLDYRGSIRHYDRQTYYDGTDQSLLLGVTHNLSKHVILSLRESAGLFSGGFGPMGLYSTVPFDPSTTFAPTTDFFDNRTMYMSTQADLTWQKTARLSFDFGGDGFLVRRRSTALYGVTGRGARADVQYRFTRHTTIGAAYEYTSFDFTRVFSGTDLHSFLGSYSVRLTRSVEFTAYAGIMRMETKFIQSVPVDPVVAALIGQSQGNILVHTISQLPTGNGRLSKTFRTGVAFISAGYTVMPGNGLFLTTKAGTASVGYDYTGLRRWSFHAQVDGFRGTSVGNVQGNYNTYDAGLTVTRRISGVVSGLVSFNARKYASPNFALYNRVFYDARIGVAFSPGDVPLRIW